ncbi:MAG: GatB/YqeY domain-containing protein [Patescibacteria group bacterium]
MPIQQQIEQDFLSAFKNKAEAEVSALRMLKSALINRKIEKGVAKDENLGDEEVLAVLKSEVKKRKDSILEYEKGGRPDLADKEKAEVDLIGKYLPEELGEEALLEMVKEAITETGAANPADFGKVMGLAMKKAAGAADGQVVSRLVKEELSK